jgi:hypothetical protein
MKNVINNLLKDLYRKVPMEILNEAFYRLRKESNRSLDALIKEYIIVDVVLSNCNLYAGKVKNIVLYQQYGKDIDDTMLHAAMSGNYGVYAIPPEARENRPIVAVLDVAYPTTMAIYGTFPNIGVTGRSVANGIDEMLSSFTHEPAYVTPTPMLIDGDAGIIQLSPPASLHVDWILSCMLAYDKEFTNISLNMLNPLKNMVEYAAKSFIYNELIIKINQGYLQSGLQLESVRSMIESYADANEKFDEALRKFRGASTFSQDALRNMLSLMIGS